MEIISGNLLVAVTIIGIWLFMFLWARLYDGAFESVFSFCREKNRKQELALAVKMTVEISVVCIGLYYLLCTFLRVNAVPVFYLFFVCFAIVFAHLIVAQASKKNAGVMIFGIFGLIATPQILALCILIFEIKLDVYCGYGALVLLAADILMGRDIQKYWRQGDL